jgi:hypothetical protein
MSTMYVTEFADAGYNSSGSSLGVEPMLADQVVTFTGTAGASAAFQGTTKLVRIHVDGIASIKFGTAPTAVANTNRRMTAGMTEYFIVPQGAAYKVSAVTST